MAKKRITKKKKVAKLIADFGKTCEEMTARLKELPLHPDQSPTTLVFICQNLIRHRYEIDRIKTHLDMIRKSDRMFFLRKE